MIRARVVGAGGFMLTQLLLHRLEEPQPRSGEDRIMSLSALEKDAIKKAVRFYNGNITKTSKALGIGRNTLYEKMKKYGIGQ